MDKNQGTARIYNACWWLRNARGQEKRAACIARLARLILTALKESQGEREAESVLYALAGGLYDGRDPRFTI